MGHTGRCQEVPGEEAHGTGWQACQRDTPVRTRCPGAKAAEPRQRPGVWESHSRPQGVRHVCECEGGAQSVRRAGRFKLRQSRVVDLGSRRQQTVQGTEWRQRTARVLCWSAPAVITKSHTPGQLPDRTSFSQFCGLSSLSPRC